MDIRRPTGDVSGFCWIDASICERKRELTIAKKVGKPTECVTQRTAFCARLSDPADLIRQTFCARTAENCEVRRQFLIDNPGSGLEQLGPCQPTVNTDSFALDDAAAQLEHAP